MAKAKGNIVIDIERCKGCEICIPACPQDVIALAKNVNRKGYHYTETVNNGCTGCTNCAIVCPDGVITVYRLKKTTV